MISPFPSFKRYTQALSTPKDNDFAERRKTAIEARKALLEKFKAKPDENDPAVQAKIAERNLTTKLGAYTSPSGKIS